MGTMESIWKTCGDRGEGIIQSENVRKSRLNIYKNKEKCTKTRGCRWDRWKLEIGKHLEKGFVIPH